MNFSEIWNYPGPIICQEMESFTVSTRPERDLVLPDTDGQLPGNGKEGF